jgi:hypothetical protein
MMFLCLSVLPLDEVNSRLLWFLLKDTEFVNHLDRWQNIKTSL